MPTAAEPDILTWTKRHEQFSGKGKAYSQWFDITSDPPPAGYTLQTVEFHLEGDRHLTNRLRTPVLLLLGLARLFFFLGLLAILVCFVAVPAQHRTIYQLLAVGVVGSFGSYVLRRGYDRALYKPNLLRLTAVR